jgi:hypothetical protein
MSRKNGLRPLRERRSRAETQRQRVYHAHRLLGSQIPQEKDVVRVRTTYDAMTDGWTGHASPARFLDLIRGTRRR